MSNPARAEENKLFGRRLMPMPTRGQPGEHLCSLYDSLKRARKFRWLQKCPFSPMDPARVAGTLWDVLYYVAGAVNRFLRPAPFNITSHDLLQHSTAESGSGGDGHAADVCRGEAARAPSAAPPAWAGDKTPNAAIKAPGPWSDSAEDSAATFRGEKTTASLENSRRPKGQEEMKNADGEGEENLSADHRPTDEQHARITTSDVNRDDDAPTRTSEMDTATIAVDLSRRAYDSERQIKSADVNGQSDAVTGEQVVADEDRDEEEAEAEPAQEMGKAFGNLPSRVREASRRPPCEETLPEHSDEDFALGNKMQGFPRFEKSEEDLSRRDSREEAAESRAKRRVILETEATCAASKMGGKLAQGGSAAPRSPTDGGTGELQEGTEEAVALERARRLHDAAGDNDDTGRETLGFARDKERTGAAGEARSGLGGSSLAGGEMKPESGAVRDQRSGEVEMTTALDLRTTTRGTEETTPGSDGRRRDALLDTGVPTAWPEGHLDPKQDQFSNESRYDAESFSIISSPESGFSDRSFGDSRSAACTDFAVEQAAAQEVLEMKTLEILKSDSEDELDDFSGKKTIAQSADKPQSQLEVSGFVLNFAPQRSRMAVKNPRVRPPKDRRSLLQRPSRPPGSPPQPPSKIPVGVHVLGGFRLGLQLPGLAAAFPVAKKMEAEPKAAPKADAPRPAAAPPQPKWMPPRQALGNPFMSELKIKLKRATKN